MKTLLRNETIDVAKICDTYVIYSESYKSQRWAWHIQLKTFIPHWIESIISYENRIPVFNLNSFGFYKLNND